jgi:hypothetical protein
VLSERRYDDRERIPAAELFANFPVAALLQTADGR